MTSFCMITYSRMQRNLRLFVLEIKYMSASSILRGRSVVQNNLDLEACRAVYFLNN
jgi:hypothetical protein